LFRVVADPNSRFSVDWIRSAMKQILEAVRHLHSLNIAHRDISLENLLVDDSQTVVKLFDFGHAARIKSSTGDVLRYWAIRGKAYYMSPEQHVPTRAAIPDVTCPDGHEGAGPVMLPVHGFYTEFRFPSDAVAGRTYTVEPAGYRLVPADMFACGVVFFIMHAQQPPWGKCSLTEREGVNFQFFSSQPGRPEGDIENLMNMLAIPSLPANAIDLLGRLLHVKPADRPDTEEALDCSWFCDHSRTARPGDSTTCCEGGLQQMMKSVSGRVVSAFKSQ